jgi:hypothetical protein
MKSASRIRCYLPVLSCGFAVVLICSGGQGAVVFAQETEPSVEQTVDTPAESVKELPELPTHKQVKVIRPQFVQDTAKASEDPVEGSSPTAAAVEANFHQSHGPVLKTFCLDADGKILAGLSQGGKHALQMLDPEGAFLSQIDLPFEPQVINQAPDGTIFIAGPGKLAKMTASGELLKAVDAPWLGDPEELKKELREEMRKQYEGIIENLQSTVERLDERIQKLEEEVEETPSERNEKRIKALQKQRDSQAQQMEALRTQLEESMDADAMVSRRLSSTGIAANSSDLFVCASGKGFRYEVWRMDHDFGSPERVVDTLSGCCGQCDIQCDEENLIVAANTEFAVQVRSRDGQSMNKFGQRGGKEGFGSCCNPMNVRVLPNGDILTAESSIGWIKKFTRQGELLATIGKAKIGGGCKHVPIGFNEKLDRYYMQYEDRSEICVLDPIASLTGPTEDDISAQQARDGLGKKLIGKWNNTGDPAANKGVILRILGGDEEEESASSMMPKTIEFSADGKMSAKGSAYGMDQGRWEAVRQSGNKLVIDQLKDDDSGFNIEIEFESDDVANFKLMMDVHELARAKFKRDTGSEKESEIEAHPETQDDEK